MGKQQLTESGGEIRPPDRAYANKLVYEAKQAYELWQIASSASQQAKARANYGLAAQDLYEHLEPDLYNIADRWLTRTSAPRQAAYGEVVDAIAKSLFGQLLSSLPGIPLEGQADVRDILLGLAERSLYS